MGQTNRVSGVATKIIHRPAISFYVRDRDDPMEDYVLNMRDATSVRYHTTDVAAFSRSSWHDIDVLLNTGGWKTVTTKLRMNQFAREYGLPYHVYQKDYVWYVSANGSDEDFELERAMYLWFNHGKVETVRNVYNIKYF